MVALKGQIWTVETIFYTGFSPAQPGIMPDKNVIYPGCNCT